MNVAISSQTAAQIYSVEYVPLVQTHSPRYSTVLYLGGINSILAGLSAAQVWADIQQTLDAARNEGHRVVVNNITPFHNYSGWTAPFETVRTTVNASIAGWCSGKPGVTCVDLAAHMGDGATPPNLQGIYDRGDGLHFNQAGCTEYGDFVKGQAF